MPVCKSPAGTTHPTGNNPGAISADPELHFGLCVILCEVYPPPGTNENL